MLALMRQKWKQSSQFDKLLQSLYYELTLLASKIEAENQILLNEHEHHVKIVHEYGNNENLLPESPESPKINGNLKHVNRISTKEQVFEESAAESLDSTKDTHSKILITCSFDNSII